MLNRSPRLAACSARWARALRGDRGASTLELAILAPIVFVLVGGVIQAGLTWQASTVALAAAQQGSDAGRLFGAPPDAGRRTTTEFLNRAPGWLSGATVEVATSGTQVTVTVTGQSLRLIPGPWTAIRKTSTGPRERVTGP